LEVVSFASAPLRLLPFGLLVFALVCVPLRILSEDGLPRYRKLGDQLARVQVQNAQLERAIARRSREVTALRSDPEAVERIARDELGMVHEDELVFQFAPGPATFLTRAADLR
jgi:cell division protein FtsB